MVMPLISPLEVAVGESEEGNKDVDDADSLLFKDNPVDDDGIRSGVVALEGVEWDPFTNCCSFSKVCNRPDSCCSFDSNLSLMLW